LLANERLRRTSAAARAGSIGGSLRASASLNELDAEEKPAQAAPFSDRLTGDWGGRRTELAKRGVGLDLEYTGFFQGLFQGEGNDDWDYGGRVDAFANVDTGKAGLWSYGAIRTHLELRHGNLPFFRGGALLPINGGTALPLEAEGRIEATSIYLAQQLSRETSLLAGKINVVDLLANDLFFGGWGTRRFQNIAFVAPPSGVTPPVIMGAIVNVKTDPLVYTFMVFDPNDRTRDYFPSDLFDDGLNLSLGATHIGMVSGRTTTYNLSGTYSNKDRLDLSEVLFPPGLRTGDKSDSFHVSFQFGHLLEEDPQRPGDGWGLFVRASLADGNPNPIRSSVIGGIGGRSPFRGREGDRFGVGYFYYGLSKDLRTAVQPIRDFGGEQGFELFYDAPVTPWLRLGLDLQLIDPATRGRDSIVAGGLRCNIRF
jgi:porin